MFEFNNDVARRLDDVSILHDTLVKVVSRDVVSVVSGVRDVEPHFDKAHVGIVVLMELYCYLAGCENEGESKS